MQKQQHRCHFSLHHCSCKYHQQCVFCQHGGVEMLSSDSGKKLLLQKIKKQVEDCSKSYIIDKRYPFLSCWVLISAWQKEWEEQFEKDFKIKSMNIISLLIQQDRKQLAHRLWTCLQAESIYSLEQLHQLQNIPIFMEKLMKDYGFNLGELADLRIFLKDK